MGLELKPKANLQKAEEGAARSSWRPRTQRTARPRPESPRRRVLSLLLCMSSAAITTTPFLLAVVADTVLIDWIVLLD